MVSIENLYQQAEQIHKEKMTFKDNNFLNDLLEKARKTNRIDKINPKSFRDLYGAEVIDNDLNWVRQQKQKHLEQNSDSEIWHKKIADILEAILHDQIEKNDFFGPRVNTIKTCKYDDFINHIDSIIEISKPDQRIPDYSGVALDVTSASNPNSLSKKINRILNNISNNRLAKIKYFQSDESNIRGELRNVPLFVIGCDLKHTEELAQKWLDNDLRELADHPIQSILIKQIIEQAEQFRNYAESIGQEDIAEIYDQILKDFLEIKEEKQKVLDNINQDPKKRRYIEEDTVTNNLKDIIRDYVQQNK